MGPGTSFGYVKPPISPKTNGAYVFTDVNSGLIIGVPGASLNQGAVLIQWALDTSPDQNWYFIQNGVFWNIQDVNSGLYMDISGGSKNRRSRRLPVAGRWRTKPTVVSDSDTVPSSSVMAA